MYRRADDMMMLGRTPLGAQISRNEEVSVERNGLFSARITRCGMYKSQDACVVTSLNTVFVAIIFSLGRLFPHVYLLSGVHCRGVHVCSTTSFPWIFYVRFGIKLNSYSSLDTHTYTHYTADPKA